MSHFGRSRVLAAAAGLCLLPAAVIAQQQQRQMPLPQDLLKQARSMPTPMTADGHPDLSGTWNGLGDRQLSNAGIEVAADSTEDLYTGAVIATFPADNKRRNVSDSERANTLLRRMGSNKPIYKPQYWTRVQNFDANSNEDDPAYHCMAAGVPRIGVASQIAQSPTRLILIYPGQGGLLATQATYRVIPTDGRDHTPLDDLDPTWNGEGIGHWEGDTMVIDTIGFNSSTYLDQVGGYFHSENMHVVERMHRDGNTLTWQATIEDPDVLLKPWTTNKRVVSLNPDPKAVLGESMPCSERDFAHAVTKEHH
jgi:hypothetical protein